MPHSEHVEKLLRAIGPFYEYVNEDSGNDEEENDNEPDNDDDEDDREVARNNTSGENCNSETDAVTTSMTSCIMVNSTVSSVLEPPLDYKPCNGKLVNGANHVVTNGNHVKKQLNGDTSLSILNGSASSSNDRDYASG